MTEHMIEKIKKKEILQEILLGDLYFKRISYVLKDFKTKNPIGLAFVCESSIQRNKVYVDVYLDTGGLEELMKSFNDDPVFFNKKIFLQDAKIRLKEDYKYKISSKGVEFEDSDDFEGDE